MIFIMCIFSSLFVLHCHFVFFNELVLFIQFCHFCFDFDTSAASVCIFCLSLCCVSFHIFILFFSSCTFFISLYFLFCPALPFLKSCWACPLQRTSFKSLYPFLPCTFFPSCMSLSRSSLRFPYFPFCPALNLLKSCWLCMLQIPPTAYFFLFTPPSVTSLYCGFYLYCVSNTFFLNFTICFFFIDLVLISLVWRDARKISN